MTIRKTLSKYWWEIILAVFLLSLSMFGYFIHFTIFLDLYHILIFMIGDIAFIPIEILVVTLILDQILNWRDKQSLLKKLNMVIGMFFREVGIELLNRFATKDPNRGRICKELQIEQGWPKKKFSRVANNLHTNEITISIGDSTELQDLKRFLVEKWNFLLGLLGNPNLLEHESFIELLWAVFHLSEELANRNDLEHIPDADLEHLIGDIKRAYKFLTTEWLAYMHHLSREYPFLFSFAMRTNPFDPSACVEVRP
ncbi:MAG: hypothetical protein ACTSRW_14050 [Candidatus Helarchaeota archaeon]